MALSIDQYRGHNDAVRRWCALIRRIVCSEKSWHNAFAQP
jgi:hypothetical protein